MGKPKNPQQEKQNERQDRDYFQTPNYATDLIVPFLPRGVVWECASGSGKMADRLKSKGFPVFETDIINNENFLSYAPKWDFDMIVTNPPFSLKRKFFERCMFFNKPFALLIPVDFCGWLLRAMQDGAEWVIPTRRIDFITPTGRSGDDSSSQFHSGWLTYGMKLPKQIVIVELSNQEKENV